mmetsp:Transcript_20007/g.59446  ORF Transcript_20007/g.59446 Transcript_20007/m.59446 type:complete len:216 (+) Transcript_20007:2861-3508(+)
MPQRHLAVALDTAVLHVNAVPQLAVALLAPAQVVLKCPLRQWLEGVKLLAKVLLRDGAEAVDAPLIHKILEARLAAVVAPSIVALRSDNRLDRVEDVVLGHKAEGVGEARERLLGAVRAAHATTHHQVVPNHLAAIARDHDDTNVVGEEVNAVVARYRHRNLELSRQELRAVDRLRAILEVGAKAIVEAVLSDLRVLTVRRHELLAVKPHIVVGA